MSKEVFDDLYPGVHLMRQSLIARKLLRLILPSNDGVVLCGFCESQNCRHHHCRCQTAHTHLAQQPLSAQIGHEVSQSANADAGTNQGSLNLSRFAQREFKELMRISGTLLAAD